MNTFRTRTNTTMTNVYAAKSLQPQYKTLDIDSKAKVLIEDAIIFSKSEFSITNNLSQNDKFKLNAIRCLLNKGIDVYKNLKEYIDLLRSYSIDDYKILSKFIGSKLLDVAGLSIVDLAKQYLIGYDNIVTGFNSQPYEMSKSQIVQDNITKPRKNSKPNNKPKETSQPYGMSKSQIIQDEIIANDNKPKETSQPYGMSKSQIIQDKPISKRNKNSIRSLLLGDNQEQNKPKQQQEQNKPKQQQEQNKSKQKQQKQATKQQQQVQVNKTINKNNVDRKNKHVRVQNDVAVNKSINGASIAATFTGKHDIPQQQQQMQQTQKVQALAPVCPELNINQKVDVLKSRINFIPATGVTESAIDAYLRLLQGPYLANKLMEYKSVNGTLNQVPCNKQGFDCAFESDSNIPGKKIMIYYNTNLVYVKETKCYGNETYIELANK